MFLPMSMTMQDDDLDKDTSVAITKRLYGLLRARAESEQRTIKTVLSRILSRELSSDDDADAPDREEQGK